MWQRVPGREQKVGHLWERAWEGRQGIPIHRHEEVALLGGEEVWGDQGVQYKERARSKEAGRTRGQVVVHAQGLELYPAGSGGALETLS